MGLALGLPRLFLCMGSGFPKAAAWCLHSAKCTARKLCEGFRLPLGWSGLVWASAWDSGCVLVSLMCLLGQ